MLTPRLTNCPECADIPNLLKKIDCKLAEYANGLYNNVVFMLNQVVPAGAMIQLLAYKRILTYKQCNPDYLSDFCIDKIISKVIRLTLGCDIRPIFTPIPTTSTTSTSTTCTPLTTTTTSSSTSTSTSTSTSSTSSTTTTTTTVSILYMSFEFITPLVPDGPGTPDFENYIYIYRNGIAINDLSYSDWVSLNGYSGINVWSIGDTLTVEVSASASLTNARLTINGVIVATSAETPDMITYTTVIAGNTTIIGETYTS